MIERLNRPAARVFVIALMLCAILVQLSACAVSTNAPNNWLSSPYDASRDGFGGWITLYNGSWYQTELANGELVAVSNDSVYVLDSYHGDSLMAFAHREADYYEMTWYDQPMAGINSAVVVGTIGFTLSVGLMGMFVLPMWLILGPVFANIHSNLPTINFYSADENAAILAPYARFPQGLPAGLDRKALKPKYTHDRGYRSKYRDEN
jgi:hypothetical protein